MSVPLLFMKEAPEISLSLTCYQVVVISRSWFPISLQCCPLFLIRECACFGGELGKPWTSSSCGKKIGTDAFEMFVLKSAPTAAALGTPHVVHVAVDVRCRGQ